MLEIGFFSIAALAVVFAGISKGGFGSGAAFAAAAILATIIEPGQAIGIMLPLLMLMDVTSLKPYWKKWLNRESAILILGSLPGVALGAWLYSRTNADVFRILIGGIALGFVLWQVGQRAGVLKQAKHHMPDWAGLIAGALAGFTSFVSHAGGLPVVQATQQNRISGNNRDHILGYQFGQSCALCLSWTVHFRNPNPQCCAGPICIDWGLDGGKGASLGIRSFVFRSDIRPLNRHGTASYLDGSDIISALRQFWG
jgi:hypothetical protein